MNNSMRIVPKEIERYCRENTAPESPLLRELMAETYWESCMPKTRSGGLLVADNVLWGGDVLDPENETDRAVVEFNRHVYNDKRVELILNSFVMCFFTA